MTKRERRSRRQLLEHLHVKLPPCVTERAQDLIWDETVSAPAPNKRPPLGELFERATAGYEGLLGQLSTEKVS